MNLKNSCYIEVTLYLLYIAKQNVSKLWQRISHFNVEAAYLIEIVITWQIAIKTISVLLEYVPMQMDSHVYISVMVTTPTIKYYGVVLATLLIIPETINKTVGHRNSNTIFLLIKYSSLWGTSSIIKKKKKKSVVHFLTSHLYPVTYTVHFIFTKQRRDSLKCIQNSNVIKQVLHNFFFIS